jgi:hypothetical protein
MYRKPIPTSAHDRQQREHAPHVHAEPAAVPAAALDYQQIQALAARPATPTISLYLPTHRAGSDKKQDHTLLKNLIQEARRQADGTMSAPGADALIAPLNRLVNEPGFWAHPLDSLAVFSSATGMTHAWLPAPVPALASFSEHCHLKPIIPLIQNDGRFYVLSLTQHGVHLYRGTRHALTMIELPNTPASIEEALGEPVQERHTEVRTVQGGGQGSTRYFGTVGDEQAKGRIRHYFRIIDGTVSRLLHAEHAPLVIAGVEFLLPLYRSVNSYPHLDPAGIGEHTDPQALGALHQRAWSIVAPHYTVPALKAGERIAQLLGTPRASTDLATILPALIQGRVEDLFVASDADRWGTYDARNDVVREHHPRWATDDDLLNLALIHALATRALVQVVPRGDIPGGHDIAAVFRF